MKKRVALLGSTGSIGTSTLDVVRHLKKDVHVVGLAANKNVDLLLRQIKEFSPSVVAIGDTPSADRLKKLLSSWKVRPQVWNHSDGMERLVQRKDVDVVICGVVGARGLQSLLSAIRAGKTIGLANKEALIVAGELVMALSKKHKAPIIPVDSEHSAIYHCLQGHSSQEISQIILTASGGPFYRTTKDLDTITVEQALRHPTWKMGAKITIDSATLMNKGLEAIEAHHLFDVPMEKISIVIHPQSIVHSLVEFKDGTMLAQLSNPDMRLPIQYALTHPARVKATVNRLRLEDVKTLEFASPDFSRFPCLSLALEAGKRGGTAPAALSGANEEAVMAFIGKKISFMTIPRIVKTVVSKHQFKKCPTLKDVVTIDLWARQEARRLIHKLEK
jgi:1-deoxy-D-xylulose-5-phosphate reductoisomerase